MSYHITINPREVDTILKKLILKDGYDLTLDLSKSHGVYMYDSKYERELLDFFTCFASLPIGYNHPKMTSDADFKENLLLAALTNPSNSDIYTTQFANFVETFSRIVVPSYLKYAFFISGGALAVENAIKVAMDWKVQKNFQKGYRKEVGTRVLHFEEAFHGRSGYTMSLTNTDPAKVRFFEKFDWPRVSNPKIVFPFTDENHEDLLRREALSIAQIKQAFRQYPDEICAIIIEPIQAEGGDNHFRREFFEALRQLCDENECILIYDEVQTGVGLTGKFWAHEHLGEKARPDIVCFGKKMQVCGIIVGERIDEIETNCFKVPSRINSTWGGNLADMVRADKVLQIIEEDNLVANVEQNGNYFLDQLMTVSAAHPGVTNVRGRGFMCAMDMPTTDLRNRFIKKGLEYNILFLGCAQKTIRFRPALITQKQDIDKAIIATDKILAEIGL